VRAQSLCAARGNGLETIAGRDAARKVGEGDAVAAPRLFVDDADLAHRSSSTRLLGMTNRTRQRCGDVEVEADALLRR
jgi:hypothetical protein